MSGLRSQRPSRREFLKTSGLAAGGAIAAGLAIDRAAHAAGILKAAETPRRRILFFSRSVLYEHSVVHRNGDQLSLAEKVLTELLRPIGGDVECTKDGGVFHQDLAPYAAIASYSCGRPADLMKPKSPDRSPPLTERGWENLNQAVRAGKPLVGIHPGLWLLPEAFGADCLGHGGQQAGKSLVVSPRFPGTEGLGKSFSLVEEWFSLVNFTKDMHVVLVQDCAEMEKRGPNDHRFYDRAPYPATWARMHGKGRVFYTSMGHREDVWTNKTFQQILLGGFRWALGDAPAELTPNLDQVAAEANAFTVQKKPKP